MKQASVRITSITINNFKNIINGSLSLENTRKNYKASVVGVYGQNGSGKTALIDVLELLKYVLCGKTIPNKFADYINVDSDIATFLFDFTIKNIEETFVVSYQFSIKSVLDISGQNVDLVQFPEQKKRVSIFNELLKCPILSEKKTRMGRLIDTDTEELFLPKPKKQLLVGSNKQTDTNLEVAKQLSSVQSVHLCFLENYLTLLEEPLEKLEIPIMSFLFM